MKQIILDIDGVILDFNKGLAEYTNNKNFENPIFWNFSNDGQQSIETDNIVQEFINSKPFLKLIDQKWINVFQFLQLNRDKYHVKIITGYPHIEQRISNLKQCGLDISDIEIIHEPNNSKAEKVLMEYPDIIVEDNPAYLFSYSRLSNSKLFAPSLWKYNPINSLDGVKYYNDPFEIFQ